MPVATPENLIKMANQIALNLRANGSDDLVAAHVAALPAGHRDLRYLEDKDWHDVYYLDSDGNSSLQQFLESTNAYQFTWRAKFVSHEWRNARGEDLVGRFQSLRQEYQRLKQSGDLKKTRQSKSQFSYAAAPNPNVLSMEETTADGDLKRLQKFAQEHLCGRFGFPDSV